MNDSDLFLRILLFVTLLTSYNLALRVFHYRNLGLLNRDIILRKLQKIEPAYVTLVCSIIHLDVQDGQHIGSSRR